VPGAILVESMVLSLYVLGPHDARDDQLADLEVDPHLLLASTTRGCVRQDLRDDGGDVGDPVLAERFTEPLPSLDALESAVRSASAPLS